MFVGNCRRGRSFTNRMDEYKIKTHYFHTKSRLRQIAGTRRIVNQKTLFVNSRGSNPLYSSEKPILGAITM